jgi:cytochrome c oxidase subunit 2
MISSLWSAVAGLLGSLASAGQPGDGSFWLPSQSSTVAARVDFVWDFILWISVFFFVLVTILMLVFMVKYRGTRGTRGHGVKNTVDHNTTLELTWTIIPTLIVVAIFWFGFEVYLDMATPPSNAFQINVTGQKWKWLFTYPNGHVDESLHVPVDTDVVLTMTSEDVLHSFYIPAFRTKKDVVPGRYTKLWFNAQETGTFQVFCTEYCGTDHSQMLASVVVHEPGGYEIWMADASNIHGKYTPVEAGEILYKRFGCNACHSIDGATGIGPTWKGAFGTQRSLADGTSVEIEENYIRDSILAPQGQVAAGYDPVMPTYKGRLKDQDITALIEFMKSLQ